MQTKQVHLIDIYDVMAEKLASGGTSTFNPHGTSMLPMLHDDGDKVELKGINGKLKKYDLPLYRRDNGAFVLHRVVRRPSADGTYTMCGDNQWHLERGIRQDQLVGVVVSFYRRGRHFSVDNIGYKIYCRIWVAVMPLRHIFIGGARRLARALKRR